MGLHEGMDEDVGGFNILEQFEVDDRGRVSDSFTPGGRYHAH